MLSGWRGALGLASVGLFAAAISLATLARTNEHDPDAVTPRAAVDWALAQPLQGPVMNAYNFGGYLIFRGVAPYIDGRLELYGEEFAARYGAIEGLRTLLDGYGASWTIFEPRKSARRPARPLARPGGAPIPAKTPSYTFDRRDRQGLAPSCASRSRQA